MKKSRLPTYMEPDELTALLAVSPPQHRLYFLLCARAGLRSSEAARVRREDIIWRDGQPAILRVIGKGDKEALLPLAPSLRRALAREPDGEGWLFPGYKTHIVDRQARYWLVDLRSIQELMRHSSLSTTEIYLHLNPERLQQAVDVLDAPMLRRVS